MLDSMNNGKITEESDVEDLERELELLDLGQEELNAALELAIKEASAKKVGALLCHGANITYISYLNAFNRGDVEIFQQFLKHGWDVNSIEFGGPPIHLAVDNEPVLRFLLENGADPNARSIRKNSAGPILTPLAAAARELTASVELLLSHGANMDHEAIFEAISVRGDRLGNIQILLDHGADVNHNTRKWGTPLHYAVRYNKKDVIALLLENGADRTIKNLLGQTPADKAKADGRLEIYGLLKEH